MSIISPKTFKPKSRLATPLATMSRFREAPEKFQSFCDAVHTSFEMNKAKMQLR
jgi:hypothetical protein